MARKILLADDSVTAQNMGRKILTDAGYEVITVNNGSAALKKIAEQKPDLIVLDVYMPGYSGLEVCQRIKENKETARIPILLTVGKLEPFKPEEARKARADAFVVKPFEASELLTALTKLEDKIVPQPEPYKQGRFAKAIAAAGSEPDDEQFGDNDGGWKARLRIPGVRKARDPEPDVDYAATQGKGLRDLDAEDTDKKRKPKAPAEPEFERPIPAGLPNDITPEEIAAISAAAAQLNGSAPARAAAPEPAPVAEASPLPEVPAAQVEPVASPAVNEPTPADEPVTFASSPALQNSEPGASTAEAPPVTPEAVAENIAASASEVAASEVAASEATVAEAVSPAVATENSEPAKSEEKSEEAFAVVPAAYEPPAEMPAAEAQPAAAPEAEAAATPAPAAAETAAPEPVVAAHPAESNTPQPEASGTVAAPADDEFMTALQSLMPSKDNGSTPSPASDEDMPPALAAIVAEVDSRFLVAHPAGPRWIAEEVALAASDATLSLQKEMEQAYAAFAAIDGGRVSAVSSAPQESASAVAVAEPPAEITHAVITEIAEPPAVLAMAAAAAESGTAMNAVQSPAENVSISASQPETTTIQEVVQPADAVLHTPAPQEPQALAPSEAPVINSGDAPSPIETDIVGGTDDMAANWKNIRDSIAGAASKPAVAKEKEEVREVESAKIEAEPIAAAPETPSYSSGAADPRAIANIVDSVLAELRPKIVEEIAKKLADPRKS